MVDLHILLNLLAGNCRSLVFSPGILLEFYLILLFQDTIPQFLYSQDQMLKDVCIPHVDAYVLDAEFLLVPFYF